MKPDDLKPEVLLFYGPPGCGKTEFATAQFSDSYRLPLGRNFWLSPRALRAKHIILDDFKSNLSLSDLLQLLDRHAVEVEKKGAHLWWMPETIIITTNRSPYDWYNYSVRDYEREALFRRFDGCYKFEKNLLKIPEPVEIDINDPYQFARYTVNDALMGVIEIEHFNGDDYI